MCVPYGKMLRGKIVPNTVTKTIHTTGSIPRTCPRAPWSPSPLPPHPKPDQDDQILRPAGDPGGRSDAPRLPHPGAGPHPPSGGGGHPRRVWWGLSGHGRDLMDAQAAGGQRVLSALPAGVVRESTLYPFIGGQHHPPGRVSGARPAARHQPYPALCLPLLPGECSEGGGVPAVPVCLESARDVISVLEQEYRALYGRNLTLRPAAGGDHPPLCPDKGTCLTTTPTWRLRSIWRTTWSS